MNKIVISLVLIFISLSRTAFAYDNAALNHWLEQQVEFRDCETSPNRQPADMPQFFKNTVKEGIESLNLINPNLTAAIVSRLTSEALTVSCDAPKDGIADASTLLSNRIRIGGVSKPADQWALHERNSKIYTFHEVLHIAGADNNSTRVHNRAENTERDVVYSCSVSAFIPEGRGGEKAVAQRLSCEAAYVCGRRTCISN